MSPLVAVCFESKKTTLHVVSLPILSVSPAVSPPDRDDGVLVEGVAAVAADGDEGVGVDAAVEDGKVELHADGRTVCEAKVERAVRGPRDEPPHSGQPCSSRGVLVSSHTARRGWQPRAAVVRRGAPAFEDGGVPRASDDVGGRRDARDVEARARIVDGDVARGRRRREQRVRRGPDRRPRERGDAVGPPARERRDVLRGRADVSHAHVRVRQRRRDEPVARTAVAALTRLRVEDDGGLGVVVLR
mmetsp:Transcript_7719/g.31945  ORF Transcript_7719/g.31945 Transcript_7719/m.31945 type:complete len:245 (+) Transcript_7719:1026-1760(+)